MRGMGYWGANPQGGDTVPKDMAQNMGFIVFNYRSHTRQRR
jgi:hypothetical protein